jgi:hypothetical protein
MLVGEQAAIGTSAMGYQARAGGHLRVRLIFGIASAVEADGRPYLPAEQVEADELAFLQAAADGEVVPAGGVADVLERVLVLVGPEVMDIVKMGSRAQHRPRRGGAVMFRAELMFDADPAEKRVQMVGDVACRVDVSRAGATQLVDQNAVLLRYR